jgi:hypothetical protein
MKAKVIIENGVTTIELTPENQFEKDIIETGLLSPDILITPNVKAERFYGLYKNHMIELRIIDKSINT